MSGKGFNISQEGHVVGVLAGVDINGGAAGDRFSLKNHSHASIIVKIGASAAAPSAILVKEFAAASGGVGVAKTFDYYAEETAGGDTLATKATAAATGIVPSANDDIMYVIEIDASHLSDGYPWVEVSFTNGSGNSVIADVTAILSGARYAGDQNPTAIA